MKPYIALVAFASFTMCLLSCSNDDGEMPLPTSSQDNITFTATLTGLNEIPPNASAAKGSSILIFNNKTKVFILTTEYAQLNPLAAHIHKGAVGVSGPAIFPLSDLTSPINYTSEPLDASQEADLMANLYYINLHTSAYPDGEIRGQFIKGVSP